MPIDAPYVDGVPSVASDAARDSLIPSPSTGQKVWRYDMQALQRYDGSGWLTETYSVAGNVRLYGVSGDGTVDDGPAIRARATALSTAGGGRMLFPVPAVTYRIQSDTPIPPTVSVWLLAGAMFEIDLGVTLTINGPFHADLVQCFSGAGKVVFGPATNEINAEWWTTNAVPGTTDMAAALNAAITSVRNGARIPIRAYAISTTVTASNKSIEIGGAGWGHNAPTSGSYLKWIGVAGLPMLKIHNCHNTHVHDFRLIGKVAARPSVGLQHFQTNTNNNWQNDYNTIERLAIGRVAWDEGTLNPAEYSTQMDVGISIDGDFGGNDSNKWDMLFINACDICDASAGTGVSFP